LGHFEDVSFIEMWREIYGTRVVCDAKERTKNFILSLGSPLLFPSHVVASISLPFPV